jgi:hypothetical protein
MFSIGWPVSYLPCTMHALYASVAFEGFHRVGYGKGKRVEIVE